MARRSKEGELQLGFDMAPVRPRARELPVVASPPQTPSPVADPLTSGSKEPEVLSVAQLTRRISGLLESGIGSVWVEGEISNLRRQASGHSYFTLKDEESQLSCVLFARTASGQKTALRDGLQVQLYGEVSVYQPRGQYQLVVRLVQAKGEGQLQARFEELKRRLASEGLFDQERKRHLPRFPQRIGVVTSPTGAAIHDFLQVLHRRHPGLRVVINPVRVQGKGAAAEIAAAIAELSAGGEGVRVVDVIVVTRGGGSLEDLWEFNEEIVARAIAASAVPVVSAVGHEIDFSIADFVADLRAPTPSAAAELLAADGAELLDRCRSLVGRIAREAVALLDRYVSREELLQSSSLFREPMRRLDEARQTLDRMDEDLGGMLERRMEQLRARISTMTALLAATHPGHRLTATRQGMGSLADRLQIPVSRRLDRDRNRLERVSAALSALSPQATLARGFSITRDAERKVITSATHVKRGDRILTQLAEGEIESKVED
jgi:exodeoxyribonuclease VII large subunit